jgi:alpha-D-xyloside xylohydrolase
MKLKFYKKGGLLLTIATFIATISGNAQVFRQTIQGMDIQIEFYSPGIVRVYKTPENSRYIKESLSVIKEPEKLNLSTERQENVISMKSSAIQVTCNMKTGKVSFFDLKGNALFTEKDYGAQFTGFTDSGNKTYSPRQAFLLNKEEAIYGLGQMQTDRMNQRNQKIYMRQKQHEGGYACVPVIQSTKGYGLFWDNYSPTTYTDNPQELSFESEVGESIDYYFMYGGNADGVIARMRDLTGQAPMYPLWAFGFFQSRERYKSQQEIMEVVNKYRELGVPLDCIIQDWQYWGADSNWNSMNFDNPEFPEPQKMIDYIHKQNAKIMISIWASFGQDTKQYKELKNIRALLDFTTWPPNGGVRPYDVYNPEARKIYTDYLNKGLTGKGIDAWWTDSTEPDHLDAEEKDFDIPTAMGTYRSVVNAYPLLANKGVYENQRNYTSDKRALLLTRSAFAGQQRYATNVWSGDLRSTWEVLKKQIPSGLNFSLTGIPYWNTDIGGFFLRDYEGGVSNKAYLELYTRWFQFATFTPMQRSHGSGVAKEIYNLGEKGDWAYDSEEKYINLRYALLPYLYSTAWDVTNNAGSMLRALFMDFNDDRNVHNISNQYLFGKAFLVTPVTEPMYVSGTGNKWTNPTEDFSKVKTQDVYLPQGSVWYDFWTGETFNGGQTVKKETPVDIIPLYVRAGSIIPFGPKVQYSTEKKWDNLEIRIYPGADGEFVLYEDENDNYNYEKGVYSTIPFRWNDATQTLTVGNREGGFPGMLQSRKFKFVIVGDNNGVGDVSAKVGKIVSYNGKSKSIKF